MHGAQVVGEDTQFTWRALEAAQYTDPANPPSGSPFPNLGDLRQTHKKADVSLNRITFGEAYLILVQRIPRDTTFEIEGEALATGTATSLTAGWKMNPIARFGQPWKPGPEDLESSPPGVSPVFDTTDTQAWIRIPTHQVSLRLPLYNAGGGAIGWTAQVTPFAGAAPDGSVALDSADAVADVFALSAKRGLVAVSA